MHLENTMKSRGLRELFDTRRTDQLERLGRGVLRFGLVALLLLWGGFKFFEFEAEAIRPLIEESPFLSWLYPVLGVRGTSALIGVIEIASALLIALRAWKPVLSAAGSLVAAATFVVTLSFLATTPGVLAPSNPWGGFLLKDIILLGAALYTAAEAIHATRRSLRA